ncbi:uncharacterized protein [Nicotiana tomentosiformis]|uniref:uncharacterized protein n=1 Tax=Nicotiana tomentosiformis TaxID=4098 RepID=UPI00388C53E1
MRRMRRIPLSMKKIDGQIAQGSEVCLSRPHRVQQIVRESSGDASRPSSHAQQRVNRPSNKTKIITNNHPKSPPERQQVLQIHRKKGSGLRRKELQPRQLIDDSEQEEEELLVRRIVKTGITTTSLNPQSKGIEIREPVIYQKKASKKSDPTNKGKEKITAESESESDSDNDLLHTDMSDEDEGEPIDRVAWEKNFVNEKLIASSTAGPSTPIPPIVPEAPHTRPTEVVVPLATESAPVGDDRTMTALPMREDDIARPEGVLMNAMDADALPQTADEPSTLT